ncbi:MAG: Pr6Pr family membrane protein [Oscillospiraceae bacterium]|nr:Pr6Pr family membrane protein [Oscillospiraceae bacterium]
MRVRNRAVSLAYKVIVTVVSLAGLLMLFGFPRRALSFTTMRYYTTLSNVVCFVFFAAAAVHMAAQIRRYGPRGSSTLAPRVKGAVTIGITVTLFVYQFMLAKTPFSMNGGVSGDFFVHLLTPALVILDWALFDEKGRLGWLDPLFWTILPLSYVVYAMIAAPLGVKYYTGGRYPYFFMDVDVLGAGGVALYVGGITVGFVALSYVVVGLDRLLGRVGKSGAGKL